MRVSHAHPTAQLLPSLSLESAARPLPQSTGVQLDLMSPCSNESEVKGGSCGPIKVALPYPRHAEPLGETRSEKKRVSSKVFRIHEGNDAASELR